MSDEKNYFKSDIAIRQRFNRRIIRENSKRFIVLLSLVGLSVVCVFVAELFGYILSNVLLRVGQLTTVSFCAIFLIILVFFRNRAIKNKSLAFLSGLVIFMHAVVLLFGSYFTLYMFDVERYTYAIFIISALIISVTHMKWPFLGTIMILTVFVILNLIIYYSELSLGEYFINNVIWNFVLILLICIGNFFGTKLYWKNFLKEIEIEKMNDRLLKISQCDPLTGIFNRRKVIDELNAQIEYVNRYDGLFSVAILDIDKFKRINDKYGHGVGDDILVEFTKVINDNLRENDIMARWGGEEFVIVIPNADQDAAFMLIDRIRTIVEGHVFDEVGKVTFSAGICEYAPDFNADKIIDKADFALYISKQMGRNKVSVFKAA